MIACIDCFYLTRQQFCLAYIGMAAAIGQLVDIPLIIRALAFNLARHPEPSNVRFDPDFVASLDAATEPEDNAAVAPSYHYQWWTALVASYTDDLLHFGSLADCVEHHRLATGIGSVLLIRVRNKRYKWPAEVRRLAGTRNPLCERLSSVSWSRWRCPRRQPRYPTSCAWT